LHDIEKKQIFKSITQMTPIPLEVVNDIKSNTPSDYDHLKTGFSTTVGSVMAKKLDVSTRNHTVLLFRGFSNMVCSLVSFKLHIGTNGIDS
jgi:hypothetical protein